MDAMENGTVITRLAKEDGGIQIVAGVDRYQGIANDYPVFSDMASCDVEADVVIDFSSAEAVDALLDACMEKKLPLVLCTTGLSGEQLEKVEKAKKNIAILRSANMSVGVNLLLKLLKEAAAVLGPAGYDIEIVEKHHNKKWTRQAERRLRWRIPSTMLWTAPILMCTTEAR